MGFMTTSLRRCHWNDGYDWYVFMASIIYTAFKVDGSALFQSARIDGADFLNFDTRKGRDIHPRYFCGPRHLCQKMFQGCAIYARILKSKVSKPPFPFSSPFALNFPFLLPPFPFSFPSLFHLQLSFSPFLFSIPFPFLLSPFPFSFLLHCSPFFLSPCPFFFSCFLSPFPPPFPFPLHMERSGNL